MKHIKLFEEFLNESANEGKGTVLELNENDMSVVWMQDHYEKGKKIKMYVVPKAKASTTASNLKNRYRDDMDTEVGIMTLDQWNKLPNSQKDLTRESANEGVEVDEGLGSFFNRLKTAGSATLELSKAITAANKGDIQAVKEYMASAESKVPQEKRKELQKIFAKSVADATTNKKMSFLISKMYESVNEGG